MEERIIELEKKVSYQEKVIEDLNDVVVGQQKELDRLKIRWDDLQKQVMSGSLVKNQEDEEPPPHY